jgi:hypothetical protein
VHPLSAPHQDPYVLRATLVATLAAALSPAICAAAEPAAAPASAPYQSAFYAYRAFDAAYEQLDWQEANAAVAGRPHEATHTTVPAKAPASEHEHMESRDVAPQDEADSAPAADPHAGHEE